MILVPICSLPWRFSFQPAPVLAPASASASLTSLELSTFEESHLPAHFPQHLLPQFWDPAYPLTYLIPTSALWTLNKIIQLSHYKHHSLITLYQTELTSFLAVHRHSQTLSPCELYTHTHTHWYFILQFTCCYVNILRPYSMFPYLPRVTVSCCVSFNIPLLPTAAFSFLFL